VQESTELLGGVLRTEAPERQKRRLVIGLVSDTSHVLLKVVEGDRFHVLHVEVELCGPDAFSGEGVYQLGILGEVDLGPSCVPAVLLRAGKLRSIGGCRPVIRLLDDLCQLGLHTVRK